MTKDAQGGFDPEVATEEEVLQWLSTALSAYGRNQSRWAFGPLALRMGHRDDVAHDLLAIYDGLSEEAKERWRRAACPLVTELGAEPELAVIALDFAALVGASNVLGALPAIIASDSPPSRVLLNRIVDVVLELPGDSDLALSCLHAAASAPEFPPASGGLALTALCRLAPDDWIEHAELLTPAMVALVAGMDGDPKPLRHYARKLIRAVTLDGIAKRWPALKESSNLQWLYDALAGDPEPLVVEHGGALCLADAPHDFVPVAAAERDPRTDDLLPAVFLGFLEAGHAREALEGNLAEYWSLRLGTAPTTNWTSGAKVTATVSRLWARWSKALAEDFATLKQHSRSANDPLLVRPVLLAADEVPTLMLGHHAQWAGSDAIEAYWHLVLPSIKGDAVTNWREAQPGDDNWTLEFSQLLATGSRKRSSSLVRWQAPSQPYPPTFQFDACVQPLSETTLAGDAQN